MKIELEDVDSPEGPMKIGVISDSHGLLRPEAVLALQGCEQITMPVTLAVLEVGKTSIESRLIALLD